MLGRLFFVALIMSWSCQLSCWHVWWKEARLTVGSLVDSVLNPTTFYAIGQRWPVLGRLHIAGAGIVCRIHECTSGSEEERGGVAISSGTRSEFGIQRR